MKTTLSPLNNQLRDLYNRHWESLAASLGSLPVKDLGISNPLLMEVAPEYEKTSRKLLIVGQQTSGWEGTFAEPPQVDPVGALMAAYGGFELGKWYRPTPFWQASYVVQMSLNPSGHGFSFAWTNLVKVDQEAIRPRPDIEDLVAERFPVVADEIRILSPDVVIFFTGPYYDERLKKTFPDATMTPVDGGINHVAQVRHDALPSHSFRTYHPGYLARSRVYADVMKKLVACCLS
jgi:hypothetical protein